MPNIWYDVVHNYFTRFCSSKVLVSTNVEFGTDFMKQGLPNYQFAQAFQFVFITLITGTGIGLSVSLVASIFVAGLHFCRSAPLNGRILAITKNC